MRQIKENYGVRVVDVRMKNIAEDMIFIYFLAANTRATSIYYNRVDTLVILHQDVHLVFGKMNKNASAAKRFGIAQFDDPILYISSEENILLKIQGTDTIVKNYLKAAPFYANCFYRNVRGLHDELHVCHL